MNFNFLKKKKKYRIRVILLLLLLLPVLRIGIFAANPAGSGRAVEMVTISQGMTPGKIAAELQRKKLISSQRLFTVYSRLRGLDARLKAGTYQLNDGMSPSQILRKLATGDVYRCLFAVPEGYSTYQIAEMLQARGFFKRESFLKQCRDKEMLRDLDVPGTSVEGYLYPGAYNILPGMTERDLIEQMVVQFQEIYAARFANRAKRYPLNQMKVLTMASMIEKEAIDPSERPLIAAVFHNRLKKGMRLQSDPTAVYGIRAFAGNISKQDIMRKSSYNTYLIKGLPPGPIGNPSSAAIEAVLNPAPADYLYFVAKKDGNHYFSTTLAEHNQAVVRYLKSSSKPAPPTTGKTAEYANDHPSITGRR
ncbi:endolytic transglycosylase MltG [Geotalea sp. SG265]|uniref:endolytic transglycosylase MltG n=1 Tax=Geotalea sp. SG265 TaxID=2922867 RepID=UPI001FAEBB00|nr:endolytic transglycosylase MltG [Geotalea sp. SG265]